MNRTITWILSHKWWVIFAVCCLPVLLWVIWALSSRKGAVIAFVAIWVIHLALGFGAGYAALRLWYSRHHPLIRWLGLYINAFIIDVCSAIVLIFVARGVQLTWKFSAVMFISTLISDILRAPLIFYLIKGQAPLPPAAGKAASGELPPQFWLEAFRTIVREEIEAMKWDDPRLPDEKDKPKPPLPPTEPDPPPPPDDDQDKDGDPQGPGE